MKTRTRHCLLLALVLAFIAPVQAEPALPEALRDAAPEQLMGVGFGLMRLSEEEKEAFGTIIRSFGEEVRDTVSAEVRKNAPNRQRRVRKQVARLFEELDERVAPIVTEDRRQAYLIFKRGLRQQMQTRPNRR